LSKPTEDGAKKAEFFYKFTSNSYDGMRQILSSLDGKTNNLFTLDAALITVVMGLTYFVADKLATAGRYQAPVVLPVALSLAMFIFSILAGIAAYAPTERSVVDPTELVRELGKESYIVVLKRTAGTMAWTASQNAELADRKARWVLLMSIFMAIGLACATIGSIVFFYALLNR